MFSTHCSGLEYLTRLSVLYLVDQHTSLYVRDLDFKVISVTLPVLTKHVYTPDHYRQGQPLVIQDKDTQL